MADLTQTAANVKPLSGGAVALAVGAEALTQGQPLYLDGAKYRRCTAAGTVAQAKCEAIALTPCGVDGPVVIARAGMDIDLGATLAVGTVYAVSATTGAIAPIADLVSTNFVTPIGTATTASKLKFNPQPSGVAKA